MTDEAIEKKPPRIATAEQATGFLEERITDLETARLEVDIAQTAGEQRRLYQRFILRHGYVMGLVDAYASVDLLQPGAHDALRGRVLRTMLPSSSRGITIAGTGRSKL